MQAVALLQEVTMTRRRRMTLSKGQINTSFWGLELKKCVDVALFEFGKHRPFSYLSDVHS